MSPGNLPGAIDRETCAGQEQSKGEPRICVCHIASGDLWAGAEVQIATLLKYLMRETSLHVFAMILNPGRLADEDPKLWNRN